MNNNIYISNRLQEWYHAHKRELPWRGSTNPYEIWVSEVILQQTRVEQGWAYFIRFMERFPDVASLAAADEREVLKLWQGLGYYSRARNMHQAANQVMEHFNGEFPKTYHDLLKLRGVGDYTASAVASIAGNLPHATVDGNVYRVLSRAFEIETPIDTAAGKKEFATLANQLLDIHNPSDHNQAMMELGALICTPKLAKCHECPLQLFCAAFKNKTVYDFPKKKNKIIQQKRYLNYFHIIHHNAVYIQKRTRADIWKNLYEFPLIETNDAVDPGELMDHPKFKKMFSFAETIVLKHVKQVKHILTHQLLFVNFYTIDLPRETAFNIGDNYLKIKMNEFDNYPVSGLIEKYMSIFSLKEL